ncbi:MAG: hypothetical protein ACYCZY_05460 [Lacisediminihabitans sp.]
MAAQQTTIGQEGVPGIQQPQLAPLERGDVIDEASTSLLPRGPARVAITDSAGFTKTSGFIDDTRAFCSIPARHDMSRRSDAGYLASLVATHQLSEDDALNIARRLVAEIPIETFRLDR